MKFWKQPEEKAWISVIVDGRCIQTCEDSARLDKERKRLFGMAGIHFVAATLEQLIKVNARTVIPKRIVDKMDMLARVARR